MNTFCPLNEVEDEEVHMNMAMGSWPIAVVGKYTGELVITNWRWCSCQKGMQPGVPGRAIPSSADQLFYH